MPRQWRRVVTGNNEQGKSVIWKDGLHANVLIPAAEPHVAMTDFWINDRTPASNAGGEDTGERPITLHPPKGGSVFRIVELPPDSLRNFSNLKKIDDHAHQEGKRHPGFHKTNTLDYILVLEGEVWALMDEGETLLKAGDVLIQRGTSHAWSNRSDKPVVLAGILLDADPL